jgi:hypothetical protein
MRNNEHHKEIVLTDWYVRAPNAESYRQKSGVNANLINNSGSNANSTRNRIGGNCNLIQGNSSPSRGVNADAPQKKESAAVPGPGDHEKSLDQEKSLEITVNSEDGEHNNKSSTQPPFFTALPSPAFTDSESVGLSVAAELSSVAAPPAVKKAFGNRGVTGGRSRVGAAFSETKKRFGKVPNKNTNVGDKNGAGSVPNINVINSGNNSGSTIISPVESCNSALVIPAEKSNDSRLNLKTLKLE